MIARPTILAVLVAVCAWASACTREKGDRGPPLDEPEVPRAAVELLVERYNRGGVRSFYTMAPDGSRVLPFPGIPADVLFVAPSPDGKTLALVRHIGFDAHLWLMDRDGRNLRPLLEGSRVVETVAWSPDGTRLVFAHSAGEDYADIWIVYRDGSGATQLTFDPPNAAIFDKWPSWSPDGTRIAFASNRSGTLRLWIMDADGQGVRQVLPADLDSSESAPSWSPDGTWLAFLSETPGGAGIGLVAPDGTGYQTFELAHDVGSLTWPVGGRLVYTSDADVDYEVYSLDVATGASQRLTHHTEHDLYVVTLRHAAPGSWRGLAPAQRHDADADGASAMAAADLVADGAADLAILAPARSELRLLEGSGAGGFVPLGGLDTTAEPRALAVADVSRDGLEDAIVLVPDGLRVSRGGPGGPGLPTAHALAGTASGLAVSDLDQDGSADVAFSRSLDDGTSRVAVFTAVDPSGELVHTLDRESEHGGDGRLCAADVTGDGEVDLLVLASDSGGSAVLLPGLTGPFWPPTPAATALGAIAGAIPVCADLDGDRRADLILLRPGVPSGLSVLRSTGLSFAGPVAIDVEAASVAAADLDRDGDVDLVTVRAGSGSASFLRNLGDGRFARPVALEVGGAPVQVMAADLDGDVWPDLAVADADGTVAVLLNLGAHP